MSFTNSSSRIPAEQPELLFDEATFADPITFTIQSLMQLFVTFSRRLTYADV